MKNELEQNVQRETKKEAEQGRKRVISPKSSDIIVATAVIVVLAGLFFLLTGHFNKTGNNPDTEVSDAVNCKSDEVVYPYITEKLDEISHSIEINMIFAGEELNVVGLTYDIEYTNEQRANEALQMLTPEINIAMSDAGIKGEFITNTKMMRSGEHVMLNMFARKNDISEASAEFLFMESGGERDRNSLLGHYERLGFSCMSKKDE